MKRIAFQNENFMKRNLYINSTINKNIITLVQQEQRFVETKELVRV